MKIQAERCSAQQVRLHIARQRRLGERMIGDHDRPRWIDLAASAAMLVALAAYAAHRGFVMPWELFL